MQRARMLLLIHKTLSKREPDKQHYYYHQSPCTEETEAAKGERALEVAHSLGGGGGGEEAGVYTAWAWLPPLRGEEVKGWQARRAAFQTTHPASTICFSGP